MTDKIDFSEIRMDALQDSDALEHYGIKGMRWGVRRSRAELDRLAGRTSSKKSTSGGTSKPSSGSATKKSGTNRYISRNSDAVARGDRQVARRRRRLLSTEEIKQRIERLKLEKELKSLTDKDLAPGRTFMAEVLTVSGKTVATAVVTGVGIGLIKAAIDKEQRTPRHLASHIRLKSK